MGFFNKLFTQKNKSQGRTRVDAVDYSESLPIEEEDRIVVALAASIMAGKDKNNSYYHISSIKRIK